MLNSIINFLGKFNYYSPYCCTHVCKTFYISSNDWIQIKNFIFRNWMAKLLPNTPLGIVFKWNALKLMLLNNKVINVLLATFIWNHYDQSFRRKLFSMFSLNLINLRSTNEMYHKSSEYVIWSNLILISKLEQIYKNEEMKLLFYGA